MEAESRHLAREGRLPRRLGLYKVWGQNQLLIEQLSSCEGSTRSQHAVALTATRFEGMRHSADSLLVLRKKCYIPSMSF
jgi:hypothetical protein